MGQLRQWQRDLADPGSEIAKRELARSERPALDAAHEADVLSEQESAELRIVTEAGPSCKHKRTIVHRSFGDTFSDNELVWGQCSDCKEWVVSTLEFGGGGHIETRKMTVAERERLQAYEGRRGGAA